MIKQGGKIKTSPRMKWVTIQSPLQTFNDAATDVIIFLSQNRVGQLVTCLAADP